MKMTVVFRSSILLTTLFVLSSNRLEAQSNLALSFAAAVPGGSSSLNLSLTSPASNQPAAIQWTFSYPTANVANLSVAAGPALSSAGKTISCAGGSGTITCIAWGYNSNVIPDGVVATVSVTLSSGSALPISVINALSTLAYGRCDCDYQQRWRRLGDRRTGNYDHVYHLQSGDDKPAFFRRLHSDTQWIRGWIHQPKFELRKFYGATFTHYCVRLDQWNIFRYD